MNAGQADLEGAWSSVSEKLRPDSLVDVRYAPSTLNGSSRPSIPGKASPLPSQPAFSGQFDSRAQTRPESAWGPPQAWLRRC